MLDVRRVVLFLGMLAMTGAAAVVEPQIAVNGVPAPDSLTVSAGTAVSVAVAGGPANTTDWVALYASGAADSAYLDWKYLTGSTAPPATGLASATIQQLLPVQPGDYEIRWFASNSFQRLATSGTITVTASPTAMAINGVAPPAAATVAPGTTLAIGITSAPGNAGDWIALAPAGAPDSTYADWRYLNGTTTRPSSGLTSATLSVLAPATEGDYEIRFFVDGTYQRLTQTAFTVHASAARLTVNGVAAPAVATAAVGTTAVVALQDGPGNATDWIGMFAAGAPNAQHLAWQYVSGANGTNSFLLPGAPGNYEFRLFANNTFQVVTTSGTVTLTASTAQIAVNGTAPPDVVSAAAGSVATASVSNGPGNATDWLVLAAVGAPDSQMLDWRYLNGTTQPPASGSTTGTALFTLPAVAGNYEIRLFAAGSYERVATSGTIAVSVTAQIAVNGVSAPDPLQVLTGANLSVAVTGGPGNPADWVALAPAGSPDGTYVAWQYLNGLLTPPAAGVSSATLIFAAPSTPGDYELRLFANNTSERLAASTTVTVAAPAVAVAITQPSDGAIVTTGMSATIAADASTTDGTIQSVDFFAGATLVGSAAASPYSVSWTPSADGNHTLTAVATNANGLSATSAAIHVSACTFTVAPASLTSGAGGSTGTIAVTASAGCAWSASSDQEWAAVSPSAGSGAGTVSYTIEANTASSPRTAALTIAGQTVEVVQDAVACTFQVTPASLTVAAGGGTGTIAISASDASCFWSAATSGDPWTSLSTTGGSGSGSVTYVIQPNVSVARATTLVVAGQTIPVAQADGCIVTVTPPPLATGAVSHTPAGGVALARRSSLPAGDNFTYTGWWRVPVTNSFTDFFFFGNVDNPDPQPYIATWLGDDEGARKIVIDLWNGTDEQTLTSASLVGGEWIHVAYVKAGNSHTFYLSDAAHDVANEISTTFALGPGFAPTILATFVEGASVSGVKIWNAALTPAEIRAERDAGYAVVHTSDLYANTPLTIASDLSDSSGNGHGWTIDDLEPGALVTVAGPIGHVHAGAAGASGAFGIVASAAACAWSTSSDVSWTALAPASGAGPASVSYTVAANQSPAARTGAVTIAGQRFIVAQDSPNSCTYAVTPARIDAGAAGQTGYVAVSTAGPACAAWVPSTGADWITLDEPVFDQWSTYVPRVLADAPVAYWTFDDAEGGGTSVQDLTGHGMTATLSGGAFVTERGSLSLDGIAGQASVAASSTLTLTDAFTIELWLGTTAESGQLVGPIGDAWSLHMAEGGVVELRLLGQTLRTATAVNDDEQHMIDATWDGATVKLFVDGALGAQAPIAGTLITSAGGLTMGANPTSASGDRYAGLIDDVVVFDRALTAAQVADRYVWDNGEQSASSGVFAYTVASNEAGAIRTGAIAVVNQTVAASQAPAAAHIDSVSPNTGGAGTAVTVNGSGFGPAQNDSVLWLGSKSGTVVSWNDTQVVATVSTGAMTGTVQVRRGDMASNSLAFTVPVATITSVSPASGPVGTSVTISGSNFGVSQGAGGQVWLGTANAEVTSWSDTQIVATVADESTTGHAQVLQNGVWSNDVPFTVTGGAPHLSFVSPNSGAAGTTVSIFGSGFGATQGSASVVIGGEAAAVTQWGDTLVRVTVPAAAVTGVLKVQQNGRWSNGQTFRVPAAAGETAVTISPNVVNLVSGETRTIHALRNDGTFVTGLAWTSSDPTIVELSADDPPHMKAKLTGTVTIRAGGASADVTVHPSVGFPAGTPIWSVPGNGSNVSSMYIAVPNYDAVADVFATLQDGKVQAITSDGTVAWTVQDDVHNSYLPDFGGGLIAYRDVTLYRLHPMTGAASPAYQPTYNDARWIGLDGFTAPVIHTDGTAMVFDYASTFAHFGQSADNTDGAWVVGVNPKTGATTFRTPLANSTVTTFKTAADAAFCQYTDSGTTVYTEHAWPSQMIIAGDGYGYFSYTTYDVNGTIKRAGVQRYTDAEYALWDQVRYHLGDQVRPPDFDAALAALDALATSHGESYTFLRITLVNHDRNGAIGFANVLQPNFVRPCDRSETVVTKMHLMRVGTDGSSSDVVVKSWPKTESTIYTSLDASGYHTTHTQIGTDQITFADPGIITNADKGALYSWQAAPCVPNRAINPTGCSFEDPENHLTTTADGLVVSDVVWNPAAAFASAVQPVLQLEQGSFAGTIQRNGGQSLLVFDRSGTISWEHLATHPEEATAGGGLAGRTLGGFNIAFARDGAQVGRFGHVPTYSWHSKSYDHTADAINQVRRPTDIVWAAGYAVISGGNPSNQTFVGLAELFPGEPVSNLQDVGSDCNSQLPALPREPIGEKKEQIDALRSGLLDRLDPGSECSAFFAEEPIYRSQYFPPLKERVRTTTIYDGQRSTISMLDAGVLPGSIDQKLKDFAKSVMMCVQFQENDSHLAYPQITGARGALYLNTRRMSEIGEGTILHEVLHQVTGLGDYVKDREHATPPYDLKTLFGLVGPDGRDPDPDTTHDITSVLETRKCATPLSPR